MSCPFHIKTSAKPRWTRRKEARPQELIAAALDLFVERGYAATRLDDVASVAGVSKGTLYLYFANKEELFKAVVRENLVPVLDEAEHLVEQYQGTTAQLFRDFILGWWKRIGETKLSGISKLMLAESGNFPELAHFYHAEVISRSNVLLIRILERGIGRGEFRHIDTANANMVIVSPILMLMMWRHSFGATQCATLPPREFLETFIDLMLRGLLADSAAAPAPVSFADPSKDCS